MLRKGKILPAAVLAVSCLVWVLFLKTLCPSVHVGDSGELIVASWSLGVAHNPGYPLYSLLGRGFGFIAVGNSAFRINLFSAVCTVFAALFAFLTIVRLWRSVWLASIASGLLAVSTTVWWQSTDAEVYTLYALCLSALLYLLARFVQDGDVRFLYCAAFVFGLSLANHVSLLMMVPPILVVLWGKGLIGDPRRLVACAVLIALGLSCYIFLPIRAANHPPINWSNPATLEAFLYHVTAKEHRGKALLGAGFQGTSERFGSILKMLTTQYWWGSPIFVAIVLVGFVLLAKRHRLFLAAVLAIVSNIIYIEFLNVVPLQATGFGYPCYLTLILLFSLGLNRLWRSLPRLSVAAGICVLALGILGNWHMNDRSRDRIAYLFARNLLLPLQPGSALLVEGDNQAFTTMYLQSVEGVRPDLSTYFVYGDLGVRLSPFEGFRKLDNQPKAKSICQSHPVCYFTSSPEDLGGWAKHAVGEGLVDAIGVSGGAEERLRPWNLYDLDGIDEDAIFKRILSEEIAARYHLCRAKFYTATDKSTWLRELALASKAGKHVHYIHWLIANEYANAGMLNEAIRELQIACRLNPQDARIHNQLGTLYRKTGRNQDAISQFEEALALSPDQAGYAFNLGNALMAEGRIDDAIRRYGYALRLSPYSAEIHNNLGNALKRKGKMRLAIEHFKKAAALSSDWLAPRNNLGLAYAALGRYDLAIREYREALRIDPDSADVYCNLGSLYFYRLRDVEGAVRCWQRMLQLAPDHPQAQRIRGILSTLGERGIIGPENKGAWRKP